jgi:hypothetical protein
MVNKDIIQELNNLGSSLPTERIENVYAVPEGYFDEFAGQVQSLIWLSSMPKKNPYKIPEGYFEDLADKIMDSIRNHPDYRTSKEELAAISPLLESLNKRPVYSVPQGYFENFKIATTPEQKADSRVVSLPQRKWFRYAAAAVVTGIIALTGLMVYNNNQPINTAGTTPLAKFEKEVKKIDDVKSTDNLIEFMDAGLNEKELASNHKTSATEDVQRLLKDVSTDELKEFNEQSKDIEDVMMTN